MTLVGVSIRAAHLVVETRPIAERELRQKAAGS